jgi:hypothetical protein
MRSNVLAFVLVLSATPALAQPVAPPSPRFSVGVGAGATVVPHRPGGAGVEVGFAAGLTRRFSLETVFDVPSGSDRGHDILLVYSVQGRYALSPQPRRVAAFVTFGGVGGTERYRYLSRTATGSFAPIAPTAGVAIHYEVTRRVVLRGDVQLVLCPYLDTAGSRTSVSVWFPLGR